MSKLFLSIIFTLIYSISLASDITKEEQLILDSFKGGFGAKWFEDSVKAYRDGDFDTAKKFQDQIYEQAFDGTPMEKAHQYLEVLSKSEEAKKAMEKRKAFLDKKQESKVVKTTSSKNKNKDMKDTSNENKSSLTVTPDPISCESNEVLNKAHNINTNFNDPWVDRFWCEKSIDGNMVHNGKYFETRAHGLQLMGSYVAGKKHGTWKRFSEKGGRSYIEIYEFDELVKSYTLNEDGSIFNETKHATKKEINQKQSMNKSPDCLKARALSGYCANIASIQIRELQIKKEKELAKRTGFMSIGGTATITQATRSIMIFEENAEKYSREYKANGGSGLEPEICQIKMKNNILAEPSNPQIVRDIQKYCGDE